MDLCIDFDYSRLFCYVYQGTQSPRRQSRGRDVVLTDVTVTRPNGNVTETLELGQEVEIRYIPRSQNNSNNNNNANSNESENVLGITTSKKSHGDQENIEPSGPVRVLNFGGSDDSITKTKSSGIHRPKPVLPSNVSKRKEKEKASGDGSKESSKGSSESGRQQKQSAFSRVVKEKQGMDLEKTFPGEKEMGNLMLLILVLFMIAIWW